MRARLIATSFLVLWGHSRAFAVWIGVPDFPGIVRGADLCVYGRVTLARELDEEAREARRFRCVAEFEVYGVIFGPCKERERITIYYRSGVIDDTSFTPPEEYVVLLTELPPPFKGYESEWCHLGVFHITNRGIIRVPDKLRNPPKTRDRRNFGDFLDEIRYLRGPEVGVRPTKPSFRWDEPMTLEVTFTNPAFREMKLLFAPPPLAENSFLDQYLSAEGLPICSSGAPRDRRETKPVEVIVGPRESTRRKVTILPRFKERAKYKLSSAAWITVEYTMDLVEEVESAWEGPAFSAAAPIKIACEDADFTRRLADVGRRYAFRLESLRKTLTVGEPARVNVVAAQLASPARMERLVRSAFRGGGAWGLVPAERFPALVRQLEVTRDGRRVEVKAAEGGAATWLRRLVESYETPRGVVVCWPPGWRHLGVELDLRDYFDLTQTGHYTVRLIVPPEETGEKRALASNLIAFDLTAPE